MYQSRKVFNGFVIKTRNLNASIESNKMILPHFLDLEGMLLKKIVAVDICNRTNKRSGKIIGIEVLPQSYYSAEYDKLCTGGYYSYIHNNIKKVDISSLKKDYKTTKEITIATILWKPEII